MEKLKAGTAGPLTQVYVIVEVTDGAIKCAPDPVTINRNEEVEWIYHPTGLMVEFETTRPFGKKQHNANDQPRVRSGRHDCDTRQSFKYTITVPGAKPLDPTVVADPRSVP